MSRENILHIFGWDRKFFLSFRELIHEHFSDGKHRFVVYGEVEQGALPPSTDTVVYESLLKNIFALSTSLHKAEKIILHGLFSNHLLYLLALQPWLLKKCYWVIWGGDLYVHLAGQQNWRWRKNEFFRRAVIKRIGHLVTYIKGDFELAKEWYGASGQYHECLMYPSNLYNEYVLPTNINSGTNILVGNSADVTNNHLEVFEKLSAYKYENVMIYCPLSYGDHHYAKQVAKIGVDMFGDRFVALMNFMSFEKYLELLGKIDIAIFAHRRQQAMGNIISLLGLGKKIFIRSDVAQWKLFEEIGIKVFDVNAISLDLLDKEDVLKNKELIKKNFSVEKLIWQLECLFKAR